MLQPSATHHLRADETGPVAASLTAKGLHGDTRHWGQHQASRDLNVADPPGLPKIYLHRAENSTARPLLTTLAHVATIRARDGALAPRFFHKKGCISSEGSHPHTRGLREAQARDRGPLDDQAPRSGRADSHRAGVRRYRGERGIRRCQERADAARAP